MFRGLIFLDIRYIINWHFETHS